MSWARIEPEEGRFDEGAIRRYRAMLEALHARGIRPMICLHHFAHPVWFERGGAFTSRRSPEQFLAFARHAVSRLGDLCRDWLTEIATTNTLTGGMVRQYAPDAWAEVFGRREVR